MCIVGPVPRERVSKTTLFNPISFRLFQPNASRRSAWNRARSRTRISRQAPRSTRETLAPTWHGKRTFFSSRWPTIRHPYLSGDFCCRCVDLSVQLRSTATRQRYAYVCVCVYCVYMCVYCAAASRPEFSRSKFFAIESI